MPNPVLSIVVPAYNEEKTIAQVIRDHVAVLTNSLVSVSSWEIVCLDDASTDQTPKILAALSKEIPQLRLVTHPHNQGIYASFAHLFQDAHGDFIYVTGGDGQWPAANCQRLWDRLRETSADLVVGVRQNRNEVYGLWRQALSYGFNVLPQWLFHIRTEDANGIKLGRSAIFKEPLQSRSFFGEIERMIKARDNGFKIVFAPIEFISRTSGRAKGAKWQNIFATLRDMVQYLFRGKG